MIRYEISLIVRTIIQPSSSMVLNVGDQLAGYFYFDVNANPPGNPGCDNVTPYGFNGKCAISNMDYLLHNFCINDSQLITSLTFLGDIDYLLIIKLVQKSFVLQGNDFDHFQYSGTLDSFHVQTRFNFSLTVTNIITPSTTPNMVLDIGDNFSGKCFLDPGAVPSGYIGSDSGEPFGFEGNIIIGGILFQLHSFTINSSRTITSVSFIGDIDYMLILDLTSNTFKLMGNEMERFEYSGVINNYDSVPKKPVGLKVTPV